MHQTDAGFIGKGAVQLTGLDLETKLDGYRVIAVIDSTGQARLWSRNHLPCEPKFLTILDAVKQLKLR
jgi:ATP-dependent DNA ligase